MVIVYCLLVIESINVADFSFSASRLMAMAKSVFSWNASALLLYDFLTVRYFSMSHWRSR